MPQVISIFQGLLFKLRPAVDRPPSYPMHREKIYFLAKLAQNYHVEKVKNFNVLM